MLAFGRTCRASRFTAMLSFDFSYRNPGKALQPLTAPARIAAALPRRFKPLLHPRQYAKKGMTDVMPFACWWGW